MPENIEREKLYFETLFNLLPDAVTITRLADGKFMDVNQGYLNLMRYKKNDLKNKTTLDLNVWVDEEERKRFIQILRSKGICQNFESVFRRKDGTVIHGNISSSTIQFNGETCILSITRDISEKIENRNKLQQNEKLLKETQKIAGLGSYSLNIQTGMWISSRILNEILGISGGYPRTIESWLALVHPDWRADIKHYLEHEVIAGKKAFRKEYKIIRANDGTERWVMGRGELEFSEKGDPIRMIGTILDITYRKSIELELQKEQALLNNLLDTSPVGIALLDDQGNIIYANVHGEKILGLSKDNIRQLRYDSPDWKITDIDGNAFPEEELPFAKVKSTLQACYNIEHAIEYKNNTRKIVSINASPFFGETGQFNGMVAIIDDITELKENQQKIKEQNRKLEELNATKDKLFSILGHDLKGPLGTINQLCKVYLDENINENQEKEKKFLNSIIRITERTYKLTEDLLEWSRVQRNMIKPTLKRHHLQNLIHSVINLYLQTAKNKYISLETNISPSLFVLCDDSMTQTILRNLISNAIKFTPGKGIVSITSSFNDGFANIKIKDNGIGISREQIPNLFHIANNTSTVGTANEHGTGLGLPLCKELAEIQQGHISLHSTVGKGSEFILSLRLAD